MKQLSLVSILVLVLVSTVFGSDLRKAGPKDKCPVCGMFVAKYPDFAAQIHFRDGSTIHFDGAKDLFKYYLNLPRFAPGRKPADVSAVFVTSYYDLAPIDGISAYFVAGSDVYGPMGRELIPFARETEAREFLKDHKGKVILRFLDVTSTLLKPLD
ncbi:MAG: nitrous oxide reductase accessory protein NosL [Desulfuromonadaceae bacterium]|nr:nitrous oxide reductase accessory protein NosL [Desulfuromonadaceae bacterium]MDD5104571.1 nitrous oxide reductase accessory protein NosL [Desulfuromonadaceae bacterium]